MFNFIFEGKLGEILAPVLPSNQLYLAIQHHKNGEVQELVTRYIIIIKIININIIIILLEHLNMN